MEFKLNGKPCSPARYITDLMIKRRAAHERLVLPFNYCRIKPFKDWYKFTIVKANSLLKLYSPEAIIRALNTPKGSKIWSLGASWLNEIIEEQEQILKKEEIQRQQINEVVIDIDKPVIDSPTVFKGKSIFGKLK